MNTMTRILAGLGMISLCSCASLPQVKAMIEENNRQQIEPQLATVSNRISGIETRQKATEAQWAETILLTDKLQQSREKDRQLLINYMEEQLRLTRELIEALEKPE